MTDGIGRIFGGNSYGVGGYVPQRKEEKPAEGQTLPQQNYEETQVDPNKVMDFMNRNNFFVDIVTPQPQVVGVETDPTIANRVAGYMENFETIYRVIEQEFGSELAPLVMDSVMDRLMGMV